MEQEGGIGAQLIPEEETQEAATVPEEIEIEEEKTSLPEKKRNQPSLRERRTRSHAAKKPLKEEWLVYNKVK